MASSMGKKSSSSTSSPPPGGPNRRPRELRREWHIDSTSEVAIVTLCLGEQQWTATVSCMDRTHPGILLRTMDVLARRARIPWSDVHAIEVIPGPGRFSSIRSGVTLANALGWASGVRLRSRRRLVLLVAPEYGKEPHVQRANEKER
ncbi:hypothetical protein HY632_02245 [Candidatus Uhrbacteria bacterium]|nr:hypothetical protein [Candidatus Uhrbacteria bacterium]